MAATIREDAPYKEFAKRLTKLRNDAGLTRAQLGEKIGVAGRSIINYENGERIPYGDTCAKMAKVFGITTDELLGVEDPETEMLAAELADTATSSMSARAKARAQKSIRDAESVLGAGSLTPEDRKGYILTMQRIMLEASLQATDTYTPYSLRGDDWEEQKAARHTRAEEDRKAIERKAEELDAT